MKRKFLTIASVLMTTFSFGQDNNIISSLNYPAYGVKIKVNYPNLTNGFARGFTIANEDGAVDFFGLGVLGEITNGVSSMNYGYIGSGYANPSLVFLPNGNIGVGTTDPKGYKLAVAGNMIAESVKVKLQVTWPDFVFSRSYRLPTLSETEAYFKEKGHLPGIPSAADVKANGIDLGEMNAKLLQKIEELTLHLIEQDKQVKILLQDNTLQKKDIEFLKSRLRTKTQIKGSN